MQHILYLQGYSPAEIYFPFSPNVLRKTNKIISLQNHPSPKLCFKSRFSEENIHCLFVGLIGVGKLNQNVLLGFYSVCPFSLS